MTDDVQGSHDVVIVGGGHNGLTAAAYLAKAGRSVVVLERLDQVGGAAVSAQAFDGVDAQLSRYSYLVSLLPQRIIDDLDLRVTLARRRYSSYTPVPGDSQGRGLLIDHGDATATAESFSRIGAAADAERFADLYRRTSRVAAALWPTMTAPLLSRSEARALIGDDELWDALFERPIGEFIERSLGDDLVRGVALTDALIGTFARADDASLDQNRCFLYHVIGGGTGDWDVPVGGMGAVSGELARAAREAGARIVTGAEVISIAPDGTVVARVAGRARTFAAGIVLANVAPTTLDALLASGGRVAPRGTSEAPSGGRVAPRGTSEAPSGGRVAPRGTSEAYRDHTTPGLDTRARSAPALLDHQGSARPEGAQVKVNLMLRRLPRLRDASVDPAAAFGGTFHINETYTQLDAAYRAAEAGDIPSPLPCEIYCHSLTDPSILSPELAASGAQTLTVFGLHVPDRLLTAENNDAMRERLQAAVLASLNSVLAEPIEDVLLTDAAGQLCVETKTTRDIEAALGMPGGNIFHGPLSWPFVEDDAPMTTAAERWGVATEHPNVLICGSGSRRGGAVSGLGGFAAAMAVLEAAIDS